VVYPCHRVIFLVKKILTILGIESSILGFGVFFSFDCSWLARVSLSPDCLRAYFYFSYEFVGLTLAQEMFYYIYAGFPLTNLYIHELSFYRACTNACFYKIVTYINFLSLFSKFGVC
jgi:hypothetical protein